MYTNIKIVGLTVWLFLGSLLFIDNVFARTNHVSNIDAQVYHINPQNKSLESQVISNLPNIQRIVTTGNYAWALNKDGLVSFYDGHAWSNGGMIPGTTSLKNIFPAYPINGSAPFAWAVVTNNLSRVAVSFFNGHKWLDPFELIGANIDTVKFCTSGGYAFLFYIDISGTRHMLIANFNDPLKWQDITLGPQISILGAASLNDLNPAFFILTWDSLSGYSFYRFRPKNPVPIWESLALSMNPNPRSVLVKNNSLALPIEDYTQNAIFFSNNNGDTIRKIQDDVQINIEFNNSFDNGYLCNTAATGTYPDMKFSYRCINTNISNPTWDVVPVPSSLSGKILDDLVGGNNLWLFGLWSSPDMPYIFNYDINSKKITDLQINAVAKSVNNSSIRIFNSKDILVSGADKSNNSVVFYFDSKAAKWYVLPVKPADKYFNFSTSGTTQIPLCVTNDSNVWLFFTNSIQDE